MPCVPLDDIPPNINIITTLENVSHLNEDFFSALIVKELGPVPQVKKIIPYL